MLAEVSKQAKKTFKLPKRNPRRSRKKIVMGEGDHRFFGFAEFVIVALVAALIFLVVILLKFGLS